MSAAISSSRTRRRPGSAFWNTTSTLENGTRARSGSFQTLVICVVAQPPRMPARTAAKTRSAILCRALKETSACIEGVLVGVTDRIGRRDVEERAAALGVGGDEALVAAEAAQRLALRAPHVVAGIDARLLRLPRGFLRAQEIGLQVGGADRRGGLGLGAADLALDSLQRVAGGRRA